MSASNEEELEEIISSFRRVWRSGGRASLSLHANQGELEARVVNILKATSATNRITKDFSFQFLHRHDWIFSLDPLHKIVSVENPRNHQRRQLSSNSAPIRVRTL